MWETLKAYVLYPINKHRVVRLRAQTARLRAQIAAIKAEKASSLQHHSILQIGYASVAWGALETTIDFSNWCIVHALESKEPFPLALGRKLELFRRGHNKISALAPLKAAGAKLADDIAGLSEMRNDVIHGYALQSLSKETIEIYRHTVPRGAEAHNLIAEVRSYSHGDLSSLVHQSFALAERSASHFAAISAATGQQDKVHDLTREARVGSAKLRGPGIFRSR
jgi:hypothetical protein